MSMYGFRQCKQCGTVKPIEEFYRKRGTGRYNHKCKQCVREYMLERNKNHVSEKTQKIVSSDVPGWEPLPYEVLAKMPDKEHIEYCRKWCEAHPLNIEEMKKRYTTGLFAR